MKQWMIFFIIWLTISTTAYADDGVLGGKGNTVYPIYDTSVRMMGENVSVVVKDGKSYVTCEFILQNTGEREKLMVGFPAYGTMPQNEDRETFDDHPLLYDFKTFIDGDEVPILIKKGLKAEGNNQENLYYPNWYVWDMVFKKNEVHRVENTYWMYNSYDSSGGEYVEYILRTGATWKEPITYGKITVTFEEDFDLQDLYLIGYKEYANHKNVKISIDEEEKKIVWEFYHLEPDFDIGIYYNNYHKSQKRHLLEGTIFPDDDKDKLTIQELGQKAYVDYMDKNYESSLAAMREIEKYKESETDQVSQYALQMLNWLDYYRAFIYKEKGDYEKAEYYLKTSGVIHDRNYYQLIRLYQITGNTDKYIEYLSRIVKGNLSNQAIVPWAVQELNHLPKSVKEKYGIDNINESINKIKDNRSVKEEDTSLSPKNGLQENFSIKSFAFIHIGIFMLILVIYWNIRKR